MQVGTIAKGMLVGAVAIACARGSTAGLAGQSSKTGMIDDRQKHEVNQVTEQSSLDRFKSFNPRNIANSVSFSPDGQLIAAGDAERNISLWKPDGTLIKTLTGHTDAVYITSFSPDGQILASGSEDGTIKLWKRDGTLIKTLSGHKYSVYSVSFSPDGQTLASGNRDGTIKLWKRDGTLIRTLGEPKQAGIFVASVSFSPDGKMIAAGYAESDMLELWEPSGRLIERLNIGSYSLNAVSFSPDGQTIAVGTLTEGTGIIKLRK